MDHGHVVRHEQTSWVGWIAFASFFMVLAGFFQGIYGLTALFQDNVILTTESRLWLFDLTTWGWVHLILGILMVVTGLGLLSGNVFARVMGALLVGLSAIANFLFIPVYPIWSIVALTVDALVIYAIIAHGSEMMEGVT